MHKVQSAIESVKCSEKLKVKEIKGFLDIIKSGYCGEFKSELEELVRHMECDGRSAVASAAGVLSRHLCAYDDEVSRVVKLYEFDGSYGDYPCIAGVDEVGRGPLAGPIVAASVILDRSSLQSRDIILGINDSKKLSPHLREELAEIIRSKALCFNIHQYSSMVIDEKGISWCNNEALRNAAENLSMEPQLVISDGYPVKGIRIRNEFAVKGDSKSASIACASILAKVYRDGLMKEYDTLYPEYGFASNSGYGSREHIEAIKRFGATEIHRKSFLTNIIG
ncbi:MAG: ribonuclease [Firmicutes bacterium]|nr:ribonuclease [Bacillota bacterium]